MYMFFCISQRYTIDIYEFYFEEYMLGYLLGVGFSTFWTEGRFVLTAAAPPWIQTCVNQAWSQAWLVGNGCRWSRGHIRGL